MKPFKRRKRGGLYAVFEENEARMIVNLVGQVVELLADRTTPEESSPDPLAAMVGMSGPIMPPEDPVLQRLLPDAYRDDPEEAMEFRRLSERSLSSAKMMNAELVMGSLQEGGLDIDRVETDTQSARIEVELNDIEVQAWLRSLTDVRLAVAVRLGINDEEDLMLLAQSDDEAISTMVDVYEWLGYVQETLVSALD
ncbi:DUF2017 domain-containing protein [soil metagenome]